MKFLNKILIISIFIFLNNCSGTKEKEVLLIETDIEAQMIQTYKEGLEALEKGDVLFAAKNFNTVENIYPQSIWAPRSILMAAYAYYSQDYYGDAISELERYLKKYPTSSDIVYAHFLIASCYYELIIDEKKDLSPLINSKKYFKIIVKDYPNSDYALDARFKLDLIDNILASKELYIGKYYLSKEKWIAAINRFKVIIQEYDDTEYVEEAIHRLVEVFYKIGLEEESRKYAVLLGYNYLSSEWYKESYKVFNKEYDDPISKIKKEKSNFLIKKFKNLFE